MNHPDPRWKSLLQNLLWFVVTLIVLIVLFRFLLSPVILAALWLVGLVWGVWLAVKLGQILAGGRETAVNRAKSEVALTQAADYRDKILRAIESGPGANSVRSGELRRQVNTLSAAIESLMERTTALRKNPTIQRDMKSVPKAISKLEKQLAAETDPALKRQLNHTLIGRRRQLESLERLDSIIKRAEIQIESTLSQLGTLYSQLLTGQSTSDVADYSRLSADMDEEVRLLEDQLEALREVRLGSE